MLQVEAVFFCEISSVLRRSHADCYLKGNPLAIVEVPRSVTLSQEQKQTIAREFNYSETTFLHEKESDDGPDEWIVDIFMTTTELPFAGHPTIGTACHVLSKVARGSGAKGGKIEAGFKIKAGPIELQYDVEKGLARAAIPHNMWVFLINQD